MKITERLDDLDQRMTEYAATNARWQENITDELLKNRGSTSEEDLFSRSNHLLSILAGNEFQKFIENRFLEDLYFLCMHDRQEGIEDAYDDTYSWIFRGDAMEERGWDSFPAWLKSDNGIYWITGKAGSGKSTLMKFLYTRKEIPCFLKECSGGMDIITAAFFFWNSGMDRQMSQEGLLQSLLHQILSQRPDLIQEVFPTRWAAYRKFGGCNHLLSHSELDKAFRRVATEHGKSAKFCIFVDGLDEFSGEPDDMVRWLRDITAISKIKFCTSSRPWPVFEDAFECNPSLKLEDLTYADINHYITSHFLGSPAFAELHKRDIERSRKIIRRIARKSAGVFLWVVLAVRSLLEGIRNGDRLSDIQRRLDDVPLDIEDLFRKMLWGVDTFYHEHASQLFQLVRASISPPSVLEMSFADEEDSNLAIQLPCNVLKEDSLLDRVNVMRRRLNSRSKGLLEVVPSSMPWIESGQKSSYRSHNRWKNLSTEEKTRSKVYYLHRTVKDYLAQPEVWRQIISVGPKGFNADLALCRANLLLLKTTPLLELRNHTTQIYLYTILEYAARSEWNIQSPPTTILEELDTLRHALLIKEEMRSDYLENDLSILAARHGMPLYLRSKLDQSSPYGRVEEAIRLLEVTLRGNLGLVPSNDDNGILLEDRFLEQIKILITYGPRINHRSFTQATSPWNLYLLKIKRSWNYCNHGKAIEIAHHFLERGADPTIYLDFVIDGTMSKQTRQQVQKLRELANVKAASWTPVKERTKKWPLVVQQLKSLRKVTVRIKKNQDGWQTDKDK